MSRSDPETSSPPVVLFYTDNGFGLGHLTRQAAVASRARGAFRPVFLTMSGGYGLLRELGFPTEYFPSYGTLGVSKQRWEPLVAHRVLEAIRLTGASAVVVDHVSPPGIFESLRSRTIGVKFVWSRRGLWQPGTNISALDISDSFDVIIEPGDLASPMDQGPTATRSHETVMTDPVVLIDRSEFLPRGEAREHLGIPRSGRAILINFGDSNPSEVEDLVSRAKSIVDTVADDPIHLFAPLHPLHRGRSPQIEGVLMKPVYPVARYLSAFDGAISTAGYNSFHEIMGSGLPAVFVPRSNSRIDDQARRAEFGSLSGRAHWAPNVHDQLFRDAIHKILRPRERDIAERTTSALGTMRGAHEFADIVGEVVRASGESQGVVIDEAAVPPSSPKQVRESELPATLSIAVDHDDAELQALATRGPSGASIVLIGDGDPSPLYGNGIVFESVMSEQEWLTLDRSDYSSYLDTRIAGIIERYETTRVVSPGHDSVALGS